MRKDNILIFKSARIPIGAKIESAKLTMDSHGKPRDMSLLVKEIIDREGWSPGRTVTLPAGKNVEYTSMGEGEIMGMEIHIDFLMSKDDLPDYEKYKAVLDSCLNAGVEPPADVIKFFNETYDPDEALQLFPERVPTEFDDGNRHGYEFDIDDIPEGTKTIRFYLS